jgi:hypothetical protein
VGHPVLTPSFSKFLNYFFSFNLQTIHTRKVGSENGFHLLEKNQLILKYFLRQIVKNTSKNARYIQIESTDTNKILF